MQRILILETTCDETAAAVVTDSLDVLSSVVASQDELHRRFGGVVPEIASRAHVGRILPVIDEALRRANLTTSDLDAVAVANTPGLAGSLLVGLSAAKALSLALGVPLVAVNHLQAHIYACRLTAGRDVFPCLGLIVSGGHTSLYRCAGPLDFELLGGTIDDAAGEAFDKAAKLLGLGYPGGPAIERAARGGDGARFDLPRPLKGRAGCDFSFSGLKTALLHKVRDFEDGLDDATRADLAASFQEAVADGVIDRCRNAVRLFLESHPQGRSLVAAGGVAANGLLRTRLKALAAESGMALVVPPHALCTDNAAMIAWAGIERLRLGLKDDLDAAPRARWPLDSDAVTPFHETHAAGAHSQGKSPAAQAVYGARPHGRRGNRFRRRHRRYWAVAS